MSYFTLFGKYIKLLELKEHKNIKTKLIFNATTLYIATCT